jgi:hypothetical protein|tara:strand:- start:480 stop:812 length:333 start_codon:yes stop_codon:yes gene_type:complete
MPIAYPYRMSDWYGYDKDCSSVTAFNTTGIARNACNFNSSDRTFYHDGSGTYPTTGDIVYSNSAGTTKVSGGERRWFLTNGNGGGVYTVQFANIGSPNTGLIISVDICII